MFADGDRVEWPDAGLVGTVKRVSDIGIAVEFVIEKEPRLYSFTTEGKVWEHAARASLRKCSQVRAKVNPRFVFMTPAGRAYLYDSIQEAAEAGHAVFFKTWLAYESADDAADHGAVL